MYSIPAIAHPRTITRFLASKTAPLWGKELAQEYPHTRYWRDRSDSFSLKDLNDFAAVILDAKRTGADIDDALQNRLPPQSTWYTWRETVKPDLIAYLEDHLSRTVIDRNLDVIQDLWSEAASDADESSATDLFASYDYVEIIWKIGQNRYLDDNQVYSHRPWPEFGELVVDANLQFALNQLGYTVADYRKASKNKHAAYQPLTAMKRRRAEPIIPLKRVEEAIDNACSTNFMFAFYAIVPITDLIALDLNKPITFDKAWFASTDPMNGTFHDVPIEAPLTLSDGPDGELLTGGSFRYQPADICCLHTPHYHTRIHN